MRKGILYPISGCLKKRINTSNKAFTFMEVLVSMSLFLLISNGFAMSVICANRAISRINHKYIAMNYAREFIDTKIAESRDIYTERGVLDPDQGEGFNRLAETVGWQEYELPDGTFKDDLSGTLKYMIENGILEKQITGGDEEIIWVAAADYTFKKISVTVSWKETKPNESEHTILKEQTWVIYIADKRKDLGF